VSGLPFLKWCGGKRALLPSILPLVPPAVDTYYEPFLGGGAVFFALASERRFARAVLSDINLELVRSYRALQADVDSVLRALDRHVHTKEHYLRIREQQPAHLSDAACAARMIVLNRAGFNGLYRVNRQGQFNVPFGRQRLLDGFIQPERLRAAAAALDDARVEICHGDFREAQPGPTDFAYYDPPYVPVSKTAGFTSYAGTRFGAEEHAALAQLIRDHNREQIPALLSNSDCEATRQLYRNLACCEVGARRPVNRDPSGRGAVGELLVMTWTVAGTWQRLRESIDEERDPRQATLFEAPVAVQPFRRRARGAQRRHPGELGDRSRAAQ